MVTLEAKPLEIKVNIPNYGLFTVRRLGAGAEAEIRSRLSKAIELSNKIQENYKDIIDKENRLIKEHDDQGLERLRSQPRYASVRSEQKKVDQLLEKANEYANRCYLALWSAEDHNSLERLFADLTTEQIQDLYKQAIKMANDDEVREDA